MTNEISAYLEQHKNKSLLKFMTCGSVDDGKSTLIGRLLYDTKVIYEDQLDSIKQVSKKHGTAGDAIDLALLVDGLQAEREQGITIDVAYRFFSTDTRKFIIADAPGHEQYTRNMVTAASVVDAAIVLIDARKGIQTQTKRHSFILHLMGVKSVIVTVNKMDLVGYDEEIFAQIQQAYLEFSESLNFDNVSFIPISALTGDNITQPSENMPWSGDDTLLSMLENTTLPDEEIADLRFPVQFVNRPTPNFRGYAGTLASGAVEVGDEVLILPSKRKTTIQNIYRPATNLDDAEVSSAIAPMAITLTLADEVDVSRGNMIVRADKPATLTSKVEVMTIWMNDQPMQLKKDYRIKASTNATLGSFSELREAVDINSLQTQSQANLGLNEIGLCEMVFHDDLMVDVYTQNKVTGSLIVIDKETNETVAAAIIVDVKDNESSQVKTVNYSAAERALNAMIREHYPEWNCKDIS